MTDVMPNITYKVDLSIQVLIQNEAYLKPTWVSPDTGRQVPPRLNMTGRPRSYRELEVIVQRPEEDTEEQTYRPHHHQQLYYNNTKVFENNTFIAVIMHRKLSQVVITEWLRFFL